MILWLFGILLAVVLVNVSSIINLAIRKEDDKFVDVAMFLLSFPSMLFVIAIIAFDDWRQDRHFDAEMKRRNLS
jgi:hypothetical protein